MPQLSDGVGAASDGGHCIDLPIVPGRPKIHAKALDSPCKNSRPPSKNSRSPIQKLSQLQRGREFLLSNFSPETVHRAEGCPSSRLSSWCLEERGGDAVSVALAGARRPAGTSALPAPHAKFWQTRPLRTIMSSGRTSVHRSIDIDWGPEFGPAGVGVESSRRPNNTLYHHPKDTCAAFYPVIFYSVTPIRRCTPDTGVDTSKQAARNGAAQAWRQGPQQHRSGDAAAAVDCCGAIKRR